jgi:hypothetical protein
MTETPSHRMVMQPPRPVVTVINGPTEKEAEGKHPAANVAAGVVKMDSAKKTETKE